ncbi:hypothetical protein GCM10027033_02100 [Leucobacter ruminantium]
MLEFDHVATSGVDAPRALPSTLARSGAARSRPREGLARAVPRGVSGRPWLGVHRVSRGVPEHPDTRAPGTRAPRHPGHSGTPARALPHDASAYARIGGHLVYKPAYCSAAEGGRSRLGG